MKIFLVRFLQIMVFFAACQTLSGQYQFDILDNNPSTHLYGIDFIIYNDMLLFCASEEVHGSELWLSDGSINGTNLLVDINPYGDSWIDYFSDFKGRIFFSADDGVHGQELWTTDGTVSGTYMLIDINPNGSSEPEHLTVCNNLLFFSADNGIDGIELWISDGTVSGTKMLKDINISGSSKPVGFMPCNDKLLFWANDTLVNNEKLWVSDGSMIGTIQLKNIRKSFTTDSEDFIFYNGKIYFGADDMIHGKELWVSDGSSTGTYMVKDINTDFNTIPESSNPKFFYIFKNKIYFRATGTFNHSELWISDGTASGTTLFKDINTNGNSLPCYFAEYNDHLYFSADDGQHGHELWVTNGTPQDTYMVTDIDTTKGSNPHALATYANKLYFVASIVPNSHLFVSDGTENGTFIIKPENTTNPSPLTLSFDFCSFKDMLFFNAAFTDFTNNIEIWRLMDTTFISITEVERNNRIEIYPNPSIGVIHVESQECIKEIKMFNLNGEIVGHWIGNYNNINIAENRKGIYILNVLSEDSSFMSKIIKF